MGSFAPFRDFRPSPDTRPHTPRQRPSLKGRLALARPRERRELGARGQRSRARVLPVTCTRAACHVSRVTCHVSRATCCVLRAACDVLRAACCVLRIACCVLRATCCARRAACCARRAACSQRGRRWRAGPSRPPSVRSYASCCRPCGAARQRIALAYEALTCDLPSSSGMGRDADAFRHVASTPALRSRPRKRPRRLAASRPPESLRRDRANVRARKAPSAFPCLRHTTQPDGPLFVEPTRRAHAARRCIGLEARRNRISRCKTAPKPNAYARDGDSPNPTRRDQGATFHDAKRCKRPRPNRASGRMREVVAASV